MNCKEGFFTHIQEENNSPKQSTLKWGEGGQYFWKTWIFIGVQHFCKRLSEENPIVEDSRPAAIAPIATLSVNISLCHEDKMFFVKINAYKVIWQYFLSSRIDLSGSGPYWRVLSTVLTTVLTSVSLRTFLFWQWKGLTCPLMSSVHYKLSIHVLLSFFISS